MTHERWKTKKVTSAVIQRSMQGTEIDGALRSLRDEETRLSLGRPKQLEFAEQSAGQERASYPEREFQRPSKSSPEVLS